MRKLMTFGGFVGAAVCMLALLFFVIAAPSQAQGGVTGFANLRVTNFYRAQPRTAIAFTSVGTITNPLFITSTGTYQRLTATTAVGVSGERVVIKPAGTVLTLINVGSNTITITETTHLKSAGNVALGQYDAATFYSDGTNWYQVSASNN